MNLPNLASMTASYPNILWKNSLEDVNVNPVQNNSYFGFPNGSNADAFGLKSFENMFNMQSEEQNAQNTFMNGSSSLFLNNNQSSSTQFLMGNLGSSGSFFNGHKKSI